MLSVSSLSLHFDSIRSWLVADNGMLQINENPYAPGGSALHQIKLGRDSFVLGLTEESGASHHIKLAKSTPT